MENGIGNTDPTSTNEGMLARNAWFRENYQEGTEKPYSVSGYPMCSALKSDLYGNRVIFPPSTKITFTFTKAPSAWYLMVPQDSADKNKYKFHLSNCALFVKTVTLNDHLYKSLVSRMEKEPIRFHYRRLAVKTEVLDSHSIYFESNNLFSDSTSPLKVYFAIVKNKSLGSDYRLNPYSFIRSLKVTPRPDMFRFQSPQYSTNLLHYQQLEILKKQQEENHKILEALTKIRMKEKKRHLKAKLKRNQQKAKILQADGNTSENESTLKPTRLAKGKSIPGRNVTKRYTKSTPVDSKVAQNVTPTISESSLPASNLETLPSVSSGEKKQKTDKRFLAHLSDFSSDEDSDDDYEPSFINDLSESETDSEDLSNYDTAESNLNEKILKTNPVAATSSSSKKSKSHHSVKVTPKPSTPPLPPQYQNLQDPEENICFVESFSLDVNSKSLDQFNIPATKMSCVSDYVRFLGKN